MLNWIFLVLIGGAVLTAALTGKMDTLSKAGLDQPAKDAVTLAIGLIGQMTFWLGLMGILREGGFLSSLARKLRPVMVRLFPDVPADHPAMGAMILNLAANMLGLGNAATPFGLKAMQELQKLNTRPGVTTNAMALFLTINTSGVAVLPLGVVAARAALGSKDPGGIILPSLLATSCSTLVGIMVCKLTEKLPYFSAERYPVVDPAASGPLKAIDAAAMKTAEEVAADKPPATGWRLWSLVGFFALFTFALGRFLWSLPEGTTALGHISPVSSYWLIPFLIGTVVFLGMGRQVRVYEVFVSSAKEGFQIAITIIPYLVAILVAIGLFRESGALNAVISFLQPITGFFGFPAEAVPMALIRPLSGSGAFAVMNDTMKTLGPDSFVGYLVSVLNGSMETTFYVLALYFGSVGVKTLRHTLVACLAADLGGIVGATVVTKLFFG